MDIVSFKEILRSIFVHCEIIEIDENKELFKYRSLEFEIEKERIERVISNLSELKQKDNTVLYSNTSYETLVRFESGRMPLVRMMEKVKIDDPQNKIHYEVGKASDEYLLFLLINLSENGLLRNFRRLFHFRAILPGREADTNDLFDFLRGAFRLIYTLRITSEEKKGIIEFEQFNNSYLFHIAYNFDSSIVEMRLLEEVVSTDRLESTRRNSDEIDPPKRKYIPDLVYHYQMAVSTESPYLQFISYYHIIEHFFEKVYNEELIKTLQKEISNPSFSIKRDNDVKKVIKIITKKIQSRKEEYSINEKEALELTLLKFIDKDVLRDKLQEYDSTLLEYYRDNEVIFSGGSQVDFESDQQKDIFKRLSSRIYSTRNSIVHSKDNDKLKYTPFKHDKYLIKEIPLLRFISEEIIISNSQLL